jgi:hypothetical protein
VFIGGRTVIGPMLEKAMARAGDTHREGAIGIPCRTAHSAGIWPLTTKRRS